MLIKSSWPCFQAGTILYGVSLGPVCYPKWYSSLLFLDSEQAERKVPLNHTFPQAGKGNGVKENRGKCGVQCVRSRPQDPSYNFDLQGNGQSSLISEEVWASASVFH